MITELHGIWLWIAGVLVLGYLLVNNIDLRWRLAKANARMYELGVMGEDEL